jgi:hypothetical protein
LHDVKPELQEQSPHWQLELQVSLPFVQGCVVPGEQTPWPEQVDQALHVPLLHVRVCVPQYGHAREIRPEHWHVPDWQVDPLGQELPHTPQLLESLSRSVQAAPSHLSHDVAIQQHFGDVPTVHTVPQSPQLLSSLRSTHLLSQQSGNIPCQHTCPHAPQLSGSQIVDVQ